MSSSLAKQLSALKLKEATQKRVDQYRQATVLYDRSEAAKIDIDHIQSLAIEGYQNLRQLNDNLASQEALIFEQKGIDRFKLTESENNVLSINLKRLVMISSISERLIRELSKSLLNTNTLKVLEYLLRNYQVHQFEGEYLVEAFLAFHSTPQYMKLIQNVDLASKSSRFHFLNANSLSGHPVSQEFLVRQLSIDASILEGYGRYVSECLADKAPSNTVFFAAPGTKLPALRSPSVSFLLAMGELAFAKGPAKLQPRFRFVVHTRESIRVDSPKMTAGKVSSRSTPVLNKSLTKRSTTPHLTSRPNECPLSYLFADQGVHLSAGTRLTNGD